MLPHGVGSLYPSSASFQSLLANISAAQRPTTLPMKPSPTSEYMTSIPSSSPPISPPISGKGGSPHHHSQSSAPPPPQSSGGGSGNPSPTPPVEDRRSSSIAALRLKAREHEMKLEMLRQNGHGDILS